jgi:histidinol-phosphatase (PHP family)
VVNEYTHLNPFTYDNYFKAIEIMKTRYKGQLTIKAGIEFGVQLHTIARYREDARKYPFDFIMMSSHEIDNQEFWLYAYQKGKTQLEVNRGYYENLLELVKNTTDYSVLAHMDVIKRYDQDGILDDEACIDLIEAILVEVIKQGKGLEVNTSSFRYGMHDLTPSKRILSLYRSLGGTILTLGSDSHKIDQLAQHMDRVRQELKDLGFTQFCTYDRLKPIIHSL